MIGHTLTAALLACLPLGSVLAHTSGTSTEPVDGATLVAASFALTGHASEGPGAALPWALGAHVAAVSFWIGALWPLHRACAPSGTLAEASVADERFGRQAALVVLGLLAAGTALAWTLVGSLHALVTTGYGLMSGRNPSPSRRLA